MYARTYAWEKPGIDFLGCRPPPAVVKLVARSLAIFCRTPDMLSDRITVFGLTALTSADLPNLASFLFRSLFYKVARKHAYG